MKRTPVWLAEKDGIGHARVRRAMRTLCGRKPAHERYAWPTRQRCFECVAKAADLEREAKPIAN